MGDSGKDHTLHEIAVQAKQGNKAALEQLLTHIKIKSVIYYVANERVGLSNAEDIYQEVCLRIHQKIRTWQERSITIWVRRITENLCTDFLTKKKSERLVITAQLPEKGTEPEQEKLFIDQEQKEIIQKTLQEMGPPCEQILTLCLFEGLDYKEIMEVLHLKRATFFEIRKKCLNTLTKKIQKVIRK